MKNTFPFPNEIFILGLCPGELAVCSYLLCCANRKMGQCWPSYKAIGRAVGMTENTVAKYVSSLEGKGLIQTENTTVTTKAGIKRNGNPLSAAVGAAGTGNRPHSLPAQCVTTRFRIVRPFAALL